MTTQEENIEKSVTRIFKSVFPDSTNHYNTLFAGTAMKMMDEVAFITATRFTRKKVVMVFPTGSILPSPFPREPSLN